MAIKYPYRHCFSAKYKHSIRNCIEILIKNNLDMLKYYKLQYNNYLLYNAYIILIIIILLFSEFCLSHNCLFF